jgi:fructokinase
MALRPEPQVPGGVAGDPVVHARDASGSGPIVAVGEILWDLLPSGPLLGGAPFNVLAHLQRLGRPTWMISAVGTDELGGQALDAARSLGVGASGIATLPDVATGVVDVRLDAAGTPEYVIRSPAAYERVSLSESEVAAIAREGPAALIHGTLALAFDGPRRAVEAIALAAPGALRVYDVNLRPGASTPELLDQLLGGADVVKLNGDEVAIVAELLDLPAGPVAVFAQAVIARYRARLVCVTHGAAGAEAITRDERVSVAGHRVAVADTIGAGDAFTAGLVDGLLAGWPLAAVVDQANALAALVASRAGATPPWSPDDLASLLPRAE